MSVAERSPEVWEIRIDKEADILAIRQLVRELTKLHKFDQFASAAMTTAASELSRNVWVHAKSGVARIGVLRGDRIGLEQWNNWNDWNG
jgi:anti-sigma regulatory factor (Ser/Thr protein kinase)